MASAVCTQYMVVQDKAREDKWTGQFDLPRWARLVRSFSERRTCKVGIQVVGV